MKAIASAAPGCVRLETMGFTYEKRPQVLLIITSPENHKRLEEIRQQHYGASPMESGWISKENAGAVKNSAAVVVNTVGSGRVINISDDPNFRAFWLGGTKLFMNAIFFGRNIDAASGREE